jgi:hypothetical protein
VNPTIGDEILSSNTITSAGEGKVMKYGGALKGDKTGNNVPTNNTSILQ